jgi:adenylate kinase family enzyme
MKKRIHIFGASGSGTTTIAESVCNKIDYSHFDSDNYFWLPTNNPFTEERPQEERIYLMENHLSNCNRWILSGSLTGWGDALIPLFDLVVFVYVPQDIRIERLKKREYERYGDTVLLGGSRYKDNEAFLEWAAAYDMGTRNGRSLPKHEKWLECIKCCVIRVVNDSLEDSISKVIKAIGIVGK